MTVSTYAATTIEHDADPTTSTAGTVLGDAAEYLQTATRTATDPDEVTARGVAAGAALGTDPEAAVTAARDQALAVLAAVPSGTRISVVGGLLLPVEEYLRTRIIELVVHGGDVARAATAAGAPVSASPPVEAVVAATLLLAEVGARRGDGPLLLAALTGRGSLPAAYSVL
ncbi:maleylpyruvate isomerase N-terminal domain-containing protein [Curtobacterium sp. MCPF17_052]|uniref:maleylpyruvate isomerase N-terminal domain-containing protein n=1 Tax=Curtobacterium sp. MCPF17_052 TaxID=2175655 RepID=UPI0024DF36DC|nr:maleylpyruvate isomerase N-terminal domain-containing protein [Curtobacterium sp. MCPF17_052]WIB11841.1 maleylpyruvate isomerase N-terminal domain-containing protein [Curtobacterium sp. MCPF17_052]